MLIETLDYAVTNREAILAGIDLRKHRTTVEAARARWNHHDPRRSQAEGDLAGIDSSWNFVPYQGFYLYAVDAVTMLRSGDYLLPPSYTVDLGTLTVKVGDEMVTSPALALESIGMEYEFEQASASVGKADMVLVDGSILARFYDRKRKKDASFYEYARAMMRERTVVYVSKTSFSNATLGGELGDMFYYNRVSSGPGYSEPFLDRTGVTISYVRLTDQSPCIKLELPGEVNSGEVRELMGILREGSVDGYPYVLRLAHERGKIGHEQMEKLANLLGLNLEIGGREVLGE